MIPKKIHYCWFGHGEKNIKTKKMLDTFNKLKSKGYTITEWNENNYDVTKNSFLLEAYRNKKWAHVSDYARLDILYEYGGIYLDTDVEVVSDFDSLLNKEMFLGFMWDCNLGTAVIGSSQQNELIEDLRETYQRDKISLNSPNNDLFTRYFLSKFDDFKLNGQSQQIDGGKIMIMDKLKFEHPSLFKKENITIHHFSQSWKKNSNAKKIIKKTIVSIFGLYLYRKYICYKSLRMSPFYNLYLKQK